MGEGPNNVIVVEKRFTKEKGDGYTYSVFPDATGKGRGGAALETAVATLEGLEEAVTPVSDTVLLDQLRFAERTAGKLTEQRAAFELRPQMKDNLAYQWARQCDELIFKKLSGVTYTDDGSNTVGEAALANTSVLYGGGKTASGDLTSGDKFVPNLVSRAKTLAKVGVRTDGTASWRIRPFMVSGKPYYGCWIHPYQALSMKDSDEWKQAQREAGLRGPENPIFTGASGIWDNVIKFAQC